MPIDVQELLARTRGRKISVRMGFGSALFLELEQRPTDDFIDSWEFFIEFPAWRLSRGTDILLVYCYSGYEENYLEILKRIDGQVLEAVECHGKFNDLIFRFSEGYGLELFNTTIPEPDSSSLTWMLSLGNGYRLSSGAGSELEYSYSDPEDR